MNKEIKIILYTILILAIIGVVWLMIWTTNPNIEEIDFDDQPTTGNVEEDITIEEKNTYENNTFEEDVMKDLEWFFGNNNGYEDVEWEYWFTNTANE